MYISLSSNIASIQARVRADAKIIPGATSAALKKTVEMCRTAGNKKVREEYNIKAGDLAKTVLIKPPRVSSLEAEIYITGWYSGGRERGRRIPLVYFDAKETYKGVTVRIKRGGSRVVLRHCYIATMKNGHIGIFTRATVWKFPSVLKGKLGKNGAGYALQKALLARIFGAIKEKGRNEYRLKEKELFGPKVMQMYKKALPIIRKKALDEFDRLLTHELEYRMSKR